MGNFYRDSDRRCGCRDDGRFEPEFRDRDRDRDRDCDRGRDRDRCERHHRCGCSICNLLFGCRHHR